MTKEEIISLYNKDPLLVTNIAQRLYKSNNHFYWHYNAFCKSRRSLSLIVFLVYYKENYKASILDLPLENIKIIVNI